MATSKLWWCVVVGVAVAASGCKAKTDLGTQCTLVRKDPSDTDPSDGTRSIPIKEKDLPPVSADSPRDYVSFGATECEDLVCVRNSGTPAGDPEADATGFCSRSCLQTNPASCETGDEQLDTSANAYVCRSLILDETTLAAIKQNNPTMYEQYFGTTQSPYFCARKAATAGGADGGT